MSRYTVVQYEDEWFIVEASATVPNRGSVIAICTEERAAIKIRDCIAAATESTTP